MYKLTLTASERRAIDWVGNRYSNGYDLYRLLWIKSEQFPNDADWDLEGEITFSIPENVAWEIARNAKNEDGHKGEYNFPCFSAELTRKMRNFCERFV